MRLQRVKGLKRLVSRKAIVTYLLLLSFFLSSGTFAYWANFVEGTDNSFTDYIRIGDLTYIEKEFTLYYELDEGTFEIPNEILVDWKTPTGETVEVDFGAVWEDDNYIEIPGTEIQGRIEFDWEIYGETWGKEFNNKKYERMYDLIEVTFEEDNPEFITLNDPQDSFGYTVSVNQNDSKSDYRLFSISDITIVITYTITYEIEVDTNTFVDTTVYREEQ